MSVYWVPSWYGDSLCRCGDFRCREGMVMRPSYLCNGISYADGTRSLYWDGPLGLIPVLYMYGAYLYSALFCFWSHPNKLSSKTEIGAHKRLLPAPFAMDSLSLCDVMWSVRYLWNNWSLVMFLAHFVCCKFMAINMFSLSLSLSLSFENILRFFLFQ